MVRAIVFMAKAHVLEGMLAGFHGVTCAPGYKGCKLALSDEALIKEGGE